MWCGERGPCNMRRISKAIEENMPGIMGLEQDVRDKEQWLMKQFFEMNLSHQQKRSSQPR